MNTIELDIDLKEIKEFIKFFTEISGYDFSGYAISSFKRRLQRILGLYSLTNLKELENKIKASHQLIETIVQEITVNTTEMFRDPEVWHKLKTDVLPELIKIKNGKIKIWHAACSSGEEVYSMCILLNELGVLNDTYILATDINNDILNVAKKGIYPIRTLETNEANFSKVFGADVKLSKYYNTIDVYNIAFNNMLSTNVEFKKLNLIESSISEHFDIIIIRNVLIYFNMELQDKVITTLTNQLKNTGYLVIGAKENILWCKSYKQYNPINLKDKIYKLK